MEHKFGLVGILNVTPNSFSDGGLYLDPAAALAQAEKLFADGAVIVDVGAEATNPKAKPIDAKEEWRRLEPVLTVLLPAYPNFKISIDTYHAETVRQAAKLGEFMINDVTTFHRKAMQEVAIETGFPCIISHLPFKFKGDIQKAHDARNKKGQLMDSVPEVKTELLQRLEEMIEIGFKKENAMFDPGIGFGKTPQTNRRLVRFGEEVLDIPVMIGYSNKSFLGSDSHRTNPRVNLEQGFIAKKSGATLIRVHDVAAHRPLLAA